MKENGTLSRPLPPHLQYKSVAVTNSRASDVSVKNSPVTNQAMQKQEQQISTHTPAVTTSPANAQQWPTIYSAQAVSGAKPESGAEKFLTFLEQKTASDAQTKNKAVAKRERSPPIQPSTADAPQSSPKVQPYMLLPPRSKFVPNPATDSDFQAFLSNHIIVSAANGKKYTFTGGQDSSQTVQAASKSGVNWSPSAALQVAGSNQKASASPFGRTDPHSASSPWDAAAKSSAPLLYVLEKILRQ